MTTSVVAMHLLLLCNNVLYNIVTPLPSTYRLYRCPVGCQTRGVIIRVTPLTPHAPVPFAVLTPSSFMSFRGVITCLGKPGITLFLCRRSMDMFVYPKCCFCVR